MPGQIPYIPFVGSGKAPEAAEEPRRTTSVSGQPGRFATRTPEKETDRAPGFALMGKPAPAYRSIIPDRPSMGTFTHQVDVSRGKGRGRTRTFEYGPGKISIPYGPDPGKVSLAMHMPRPVTSAFTMEQKSSERLNTILETVQFILESSPIRREETKRLKTMALSDMERSGNTNPPYVGAVSQRGRVWDALPSNKQTEIFGLLKFGKLKREAERNPTRSRGSTPMPVIPKDTPPQSFDNAGPFGVEPWDVR